VPRPASPVLSRRFSVPGSQSPVPSPQPSILSPRYSALSSRPHSSGLSRPASVVRPQSSGLSRRSSPRRFEPPIVKLEVSMLHRAGRSAGDRSPRSAAFGTQPAPRPDPVDILSSRLLPWWRRRGPAGTRPSRPARSRIGAGTATPHGVDHGAPPISAFEPFLTGSPATSAPQPSERVNTRSAVNGRSATRSRRAVPAPGVG
jgi:hypothetical protein